MLRSALRSFRSKLLHLLHPQIRRRTEQSRTTNPLHPFPLLGTLSDEQRKHLEQVLGFRIQKVAYYEQALLHRSALPHLHRPEAVPNERLEFLGDALLGFLVAEYLFETFPDLPEGELTKMRTWLVNRRALAICAQRLALDQLLVASSSARRAMEHGSLALLANALEALIAAVYLDQGLAAARAIVRERLLPIAEQERLLQDTNYKSLLLEHLQAHGKGTPQYRVLEERGPAHAKEFVVGVYVGNQCLGIGSGRSKKDAEQQAAFQALETLQQQPTEKPHGATHL